MSCVILCSRCWKNIQIRIPPWALSYWGNVVDDLQHCGCFRWWIQSGDTSSPLSRLSIYHLFRLGTESPNLTFFVPESLSLGHTFVFLYQHINTHSVRSRRCLGFYHVNAAGGLLKKSNYHERTRSGVAVRLQYEGTMKKVLIILRLSPAKSIPSCVRAVSAKTAYVLWVLNCTAH